MNHLRKSTITTLEVAEMMEVEHKRIIRKLEGGGSVGKNGTAGAAQA